MENLIIVGGGPAGLAAAVYAARAALNPLIIAGSTPGGQLMLTSAVENYPGFNSIMGPELMQKMLNQAKQLGARVINEDIKKIEIQDLGFKIYDASQSYETKTLLIATGAEAQWLGLESEQRLRGKGVSACATCDAPFFKDKVVGVVGGGDSAAEEALYLAKFTSKVYLIHRRDSLRAAKIMQERVLNNPKIEPVWNAEVEEVLGEEKVKGVRLKIKDLRFKNQNNNNPHQSKIINPKSLELDGLFIAIGHKPSTVFLKDSGVELDEKGYIITAARAAIEKAKIQDSRLKIQDYNYKYQYMTSVPGIFAAGDCVDNQYRQAGTAVGMGIAAELEVEKYLENYKISADK